MKIAYYIKIFSDNGIIGVLKKVCDQVHSWESQGHEVCMFLLVKDDAKLFARYTNLLNTLTVVAVKWNIKFGYVFREWQLLMKISNFKPDVLYFRYDVHFPAFIFYLHLTKIAPIAEVNSNLNQELKLGSKFLYYYSKLITKFWANRLTGTVCVTNELIKSLFSKNNKVKSIAIGNGIDLKKHNILPPSDNQTTSVCFIASNNYPWFDVNQILRFASYFPKWDFHIIGNIISEKNKSRYGKNLHFHGLLKTEEYKQIIQSTDVGIGTLALYKNKMEEGSTLKLREYLAMGLPAIIGHTDVDFKEEVPFILRLPNKENNLLDNKEKIEEFVNAWKGKRVKRKCIEHLDTSVKEKQRLDFFAKCISKYKKEGK